MLTQFKQLAADIWNFRKLRQALTDLTVAYVKAASASMEHYRTATLLEVRLIAVKNRNEKQAQIIADQKSVIATLENNIQWLTHENTDFRNELIRVQQMIEN